MTATRDGGGRDNTHTSLKRISLLRSRLLRWGPAHERSFAWRTTRSAYRVLVAELLLQRTRAEHVPNVYLRLIKSAPNPAALAALPRADLSHIVRPLGLRKRVTLIRRLARSVVEEHGGRVPHNHAALTSLPGLGTYGANAIASLARGESVPMVDGGVCRVLRRVFSLPPAKRATADKLSWELARKIVSTGNAKVLNLAMLDLASAVCTRRPKCEVCPLASLCDWYVQDVASVGTGRRMFRLNPSILGERSKP